jgi:GntR family transcriptional regulator
VTVQVVQPPADVAEWLHVQGGGLTVLRHRIRYVDEEPFQLADSYVPYDMARDNPILMAPGDQSRPGGLLADAGLVQVRAVDLLTCRMPTNTETELLNLPPATPVVRHMRTGYDEGDMPLRVMVSILPGDRHVIRYDVHLD